MDESTVLIKVQTSYTLMKKLNVCKGSIRVLCCLHMTERLRVATKKLEWRWLTLHTYFQSKMVAKMTATSLDWIIWWNSGVKLDPKPLNDNMDSWRTADGQPNGTVNIYSPINCRKGNFTFATRWCAIEKILRRKDWFRSVHRLGTEHECLSSFFLPHRSKNCVRNQSWASMAVECIRLHQNKDHAENGLVDFFRVGRRVCE